MSLTDFIKKLKADFRTIALVIFFITSATFIISAFIEPKFETMMSVIVIQKQPEDKVDAFSAAKSAEYLSDIFTKAIYTDSFIDDVVASPVGIKNQYSSNKEDRKKEWSRKVKTRKINNTGIIEITVYDTFGKESQKIAQAIAWNLSTNNSKYHGGGEKIEVNLVDGPTLSKNPVPNIWLNSLFGFFVAIFGSFGYIYFKKEDFFIR